MPPLEVMLRLSLAAAATLQMAAAESYATLNVYSSTENPRYEARDRLLQYPRPGSFERQNLNPRP